MTDSGFSSPGPDIICRQNKTSFGLMESCGGEASRRAIDDLDITDITPRGYDYICHQLHEREPMLPLPDEREPMLPLPDEREPMLPLPDEYNYKLQTTDAVIDEGEEERSLVAQQWFQLTDTLDQHWLRDGQTELIIQDYQCMV